MYNLRIQDPPFPPAEKSEACLLESLDAPRLEQNDAPRARFVAGQTAEKIGAHGVQFFQNG